MEHLANLRLIFTNLSSPTAGCQLFKKDVVLEKDKHTIPSKIVTKAVFPLDQKADCVVSASEECTINGNCKSHSVGMDTSRIARDKEKQLQTIRFLVFHCWLSFLVNNKIERLVEEKVCPSSGTATTKDRKTSKTTNTNVVERANSVGHMVAKSANTVLPLVMLKFHCSMSHHSG